jgi:hypothetical protein
VSLATWRQYRLQAAIAAALLAVIGRAGPDRPGRRGRWLLLYGDPDVPVGLFAPGAGRRAADGTAATRSCPVQRPGPGCSPALAGVTIRARNQ